MTRRAAVTRREEGIEKALHVIYDIFPVSDDTPLIPLELSELKIALESAYDAGLEDGKLYAAERFILPPRPRRRRTA